MKFDVDCGPNHLGPRLFKENCGPVLYILRILYIYICGIYEFRGTIRIFLKFLRKYYFYKFLLYIKLYF